MIDPQPAHPFFWTTESGGRALQSAVLARTARHVFTTLDLPLRGPFAGDGWGRVASAVGVPASRLVRLKQVHGADVIVVGREEPIPIEPSAGRARWILPPARPAWTAESEEDRPRADVVMTMVPDVALAVQVADCVPLLLADPVTGAVAAVHAGWRGTAARVAQIAVVALHTNFGARPEDLVAAIGPSIGACCYQVGGDVLDGFRAAGFKEPALAKWFRVEEADGRYRLDVAQANIDQLTDAGLAGNAIGACGLCTACHPSLFPSYRRDGKGTGRLAAVIRAGTGAASSTRP